MCFDGGVPRVRLSAEIAPLPRRVGSPHRAGAAGVSDRPVVLVLPAHDEGPRLHAVLRRVPPLVGTHPVVAVVVDDGSGDDTAAVARRTGAVTVTHPRNQGLGAAVRSGLA